MRSIFSSDGTSLNFPDKKLWDAYQRDCKALDDMYYAAIREKYGIWACNKNDFVKTSDEMNEFDSKTMEDRHSKYVPVRLFKLYDYGRLFDIVFDVSWHHYEDMKDKDLIFPKENCCVVFNMLPEFLQDDAFLYGLSDSPTRDSIHEHINKNYDKFCHLWSIK